MTLYPILNALGAVGQVLDDDLLGHDLARHYGGGVKSPWRRAIFTPLVHPND